MRGTLLLLAGVACVAALSLQPSSVLEKTSVLQAGGKQAGGQAHHHVQHRQAGGSARAKAQLQALSAQSSASASQIAEALSTAIESKAAEEALNDFSIFKGMQVTLFQVQNTVSVTTVAPAAGDPTPTDPAPTVSAESIVTTAGPAVSSTGEAYVDHYDNDSCSGDPFVTNHDVMNCHPFVQDQFYGKLTICDPNTGALELKVYDWSDSKCEGEATQTVSTAQQTMGKAGQCGTDPTGKGQSVKVMCGKKPVTVVDLHGVVQLKGYEVADFDATQQALWKKACAQAYGVDEEDVLITLPVQLVPAEAAASRRLLNADSSIQVDYVLNIPSTQEAAVLEAAGYTIEAQTDKLQAEVNTLKMDTIVTVISPLQNLDTEYLTPFVRTTAKGFWEAGIPLYAGKSGYFRKEFGTESDALHFVKIMTGAEKKFHLSDGNAEKFVEQLEKTVEEDEAQEEGGKTTNGGAVAMQFGRTGTWEN